MKDILKELKEMIYPGRGIIAGWTNNGNPYVSYFITGRSPSSQARRLVEFKERKYKDANLVIGIQVTDEEQLKNGDPLLLIYPAMMYIDGKIIASNGQQTDLMYSELSVAKGKSSLSTEEIIKNSFKNKESGPGIDLTSYEPDSLSTPRIAAVVDNSSMAFWIAKKLNGDVRRWHWAYSPAEAGWSNMLTTYKGGNEYLNVLSFDSDPILVNVPFNDAKSITDVVYYAMGEGNNDANFRVSVATILKKQNSFEYNINNRF